jgi:hypothetical protein
LAKPKYTFGLTELKIDRSITWTQWKKLGETAGAMARGSLWAIGDWINFGEQRFGEKYTQALDVTGLAPERLRVIAWVASRFKPGRRRMEFSFEAHRELAPIKDDTEQDLIMDELAKQGIYQSQEIREWRRSERDGTLNASPTMTATLMWEEAPDDETIEGLQADMVELFQEYEVESFKFKRKRWDT